MAPLMVTLDSFMSSESIRGTHLAHTLDICNLSWSMPCMDPYERPVASSNSWRVIRRFSITSLCTLSMFSGLVLVDGRPDRGSSSKLSLPRWNYFTQRFIVTDEGEVSP